MNNKNHKTELENTLKTRDESEQENLLKKLIDNRSLHKETIEGLDQENLLSV